MFKYYFPHCCCAVYRLQAEFLDCGVAATLASVTYEDLAAVASEMEGGTRAGTLGCSDHPGVRALIETYRVRVLWRILDYLHPDSRRMLAISSIIQKGQPLLIERRFSPGFALVGCFDCLITLSSPASVCQLLVSVFLSLRTYVILVTLSSPPVFVTRWSRFLFLYVPTSSVGTCSRHRKNVQQ